MNLKGFQLDTFLALVMVLGSAAFLGLGRMLFGALGWYMLVTIPLSFVFAGGLYVLWKVPVRIDAEDSSGVSHKVFGWRESWAFIIVSAFLVLTGFFWWISPMSKKARNLCSRLLSGGKRTKYLKCFVCSALWVRSCLTLWP